MESLNNGNNKINKTIATNEFVFDISQNTEVLGIPFLYTLEDDKLVVLPQPSKAAEFYKGLDKFSLDTLLLLNSKAVFGINARKDMFEFLYKTFVEHFPTKNKDIRLHLTLQVWYSDMVIKFGTFLEDLAGMSYACLKYQEDNYDISEVFLAYSNPKRFYKSIISDKSEGEEKIKTIFGFPTTESDLDSIFKNLSSEERKIIYNGIQKSTETIFETFTHIASAIVELNSKKDFTYYNMYNKLKHGFAPSYLFTTPVPVPLEEISEITSKEQVDSVIENYFFRNIILMHDKLYGQRTPDEQAKYNKHKMATADFTFQDVTLDTAGDMKIAVNIISELYHYLINKFLRIAKDDNELVLFISGDKLNEEELSEILAITTDKTRYI